MKAVILISIKELAVTLAKLSPNCQINVAFELSNINTEYLQSPILRSSPNINKAIELGWNPTIGVEHEFHLTI